LVNTGGHAGGRPRELVSWSQGEVRHRFLSGTKNKKNSQERKRMLYLVGRVVDLEYRLRGRAKATKKATYGVAMAKRALPPKKIRENFHRRAEAGNPGDRDDSPMAWR